MAFDVPRQPTVGIVPVTAGTTAATFPAYGMVTFGSAAAKTYTLGAPVAGREVRLLCSLATSSSIQKVQCSTSGAIDFISTSGKKEVLQFNNTGESCTLVGRNSTQWAVFGQSALAFSTV